MAFDHINAKAQALLNAPFEERLGAIRRDRFIPYEAGSVMMVEMDKILLTPSVVRARCLLLVGESGMGKTALVDFVSRHYATLLGDVAQKRLVHVILPPVTVDRAMFYQRILKGLGMPFRKTDKPDFLHEQVVDALRDFGTLVLLIDEFHNFLGAGAKKHLQEHMAAIRDIANVPVSIVAAGTRLAESCILADEQLEQRFLRYHLRAWGETDGLRDFLATWESRIPLARPSDLAGPTLLPLIIRFTLGHMRRMIELIKKAAELAVTTREECITEALLRQALQELSHVLPGYADPGVAGAPQKRVA